MAQVDQLLGDLRRHAAIASARSEPLHRAEHERYRIGAVLTRTHATHRTNTRSSPLGVPTDNPSHIECLVQIRDQIVDILDAHRQPD